MFNIILAAQNETVRCYKDDTVTAATASLSSCNTLVGIGKKNNGDTLMTFTHVDAYTDLSFIERESAWALANGCDTIQFTQCRGDKKDSETSSVLSMGLKKRGHHIKIMDLPKGSVCAGFIDGVYAIAEVDGSNLITLASMGAKKGQTRQDTLFIMKTFLRQLSLHFDPKNCEQFPDIAYDAKDTIECNAASQKTIEIISDLSRHAGDNPILKAKVRNVLKETGVPHNEELIESLVSGHLKVIFENMDKIHGIDPRFARQR